MSLIFHLMEKDARYLRYELAIWLALVLAQAGLVLSGVDARAPEPTLATIGNLYGAIWMIQIAVGGIFAAQLVQCDPQVGTTAFWRTRPIARPTLLASKLATVTVVLLGVPFVVELATCLALGIGAGDSLSAALSGIGIRAVLLAPALTMATVTPDVPRFVVSLILVLLTALLAQLTVFRPLSQAFASTDDVWPTTLTTSRFLVFYALIVACGVAVVVHQYVSQKTRRSFILVPIALAVCLLAVNAWPYDFVVRSEPPVDRARFNPDPVTVSLDPTPVDPQPISKGLQGARVGHQRLFGLLLASGVPDGRFVAPATVRGALKLADGVEFTSEPHAIPSLGPRTLTSDRRQRERAMLSALGPLAWSNLESRRGSAVAPALVDVPDTAYRTYQGMAGTYAAEVTFTAYAFETTGTMPVRAGVGYRHGPKGADIASVRFRANGDVEVMFREVSLSQGTVASWWVATGQYILVNRTTREALFPAADSAREVLSAWPGMGLIYLRLGRRFLTFKFPSGSERPTMDAAWLAQAELVRVEPVSLGAFTKPLKVDRFLLEPATVR